jgi:hypothetical protein
MQLYTGPYVSDNQIGAILAPLSLRRLVTADRQPGPIVLNARPVFVSRLFTVTWTKRS